MREGYLDDTKPTIYENDFLSHLINKHTYNFNLLIKSRSKPVSELSEEEYKNELYAYYQKYGKFINMPVEICDRVHKLLTTNIKRRVKWELKIMIMTQ